MTTNPAPPELNEVVYKLAATSATQGTPICFAAHARGVSRSSDGGQTWQTVFESPDSELPMLVTSVAISPGFQRDGRVIAAVPGAMIASVDGGETWSSAILPLPAPLISALALSPNFEHDGIAFAGTLEDGIFLTSDYGYNWVAWNVGLLDHAVLALAVSPSFQHDRTLFAGTESGIFQSSNGGRFWRELAFPSEAAPVLSLVFWSSVAEDVQIVAGTSEHGLLTARHPWDNWQSLGQTQLTEGAINDLLVAPEFPAKPDLLILHDDCLLISRDAGHSWQSCCADMAEETGLTAVVAPWGLDSGAVLIGGYVGGYMRRITIC